MAELYISLLVAALCIGTAVPLKCYTCLGVTNNADCMNPTTCSSTDTSCMTVVGSTSGSTAVVKSCAPSCSPGSSSLAGVSATISCCNTDLCNGSTAVKYSFPAMVLSLGFLLVLLRSSIL
ncbi:ly6/PLAUR domain-containing protein 2 [Xenopus laevis]|uniref:Ly6/PLAUR domain-containing protein 2 n=1 Tax=Xenopus laevis TaxID=8355 RepID=A0A8J1KZ81_XENLA|nr:ly6/PLAUR domain-containing protein 2 [Xenopus laevis]